MNGKRRLSGSFRYGSMANAVPQAIGIQAAHADRQVATLSGDRGLAMMFGDPITLQQLILPVKIVLLAPTSGIPICRALPRRLACLPHAWSNRESWPTHCIEHSITTARH